MAIAMAMAWLPVDRTMDVDSALANAIVHAHDLDRIMPASPQLLFACRLGRNTAAATRATRTARM